MKKLFAGFALLGLFTAASAQTITFDQTTLDYGTVKTNSDGHRFFTVKNTGDKPLILSDVKPSCGCTVPEWSKDPILPGKSAKIKVGYNTGANGTFKKMVEVYSNDPENNRSVLYIQGTVDPNAPEAVVVAEPAKPVDAKAAKKEARKAKKAEKTAALSK